jgi:hypothetical protein
VRVREWWVSAKPYDHPKDGCKYIERDDPFGDAVAAAQFVENNRPAANFYMVTLYSRVRIVKSPTVAKK